MSKKAAEKAEEKKPLGPGDRFVVSYIHPAEVSCFFTQSLVNLMAGPLAQYGVLAGVVSKFSGANVSHSRNEVVREFLADYEGVADWLLLVDADMVFGPMDPWRLMRLAEDLEAGSVAEGEVARPLVSGLYFGQGDGELHPHIYVTGIDEATGEERLGRMVDYPDDTVVEAVGTGAGFKLVHREVFEAVERGAYSKAYPWFQECERDGERVGEDIEFCLRAADQGHRLFVDTGLVLGHHKDGMLDAGRYRDQQELKRIRGESTEGSIKGTVNVKGGDAA